jgi:drug/metabolite transporter (DMT)-like permease
MTERRGNALAYGALFGLALIWGASFFFIKLAVADMSPTVLVLIRAFTGALTLGAFMLATRRQIFREGWRKRLLPFAVMGLTSGLAPWAAFGFGEERISSGLAGILNATTPLWTAIFAWWALPTERPTRNTYIGVAVGMVGTVVLVIPTIVANGLSGDTPGTLVVMGAAISYAFAALYQRRNLRGVDPYEASLGQLVMTTLMAIPFAVTSLGAFHFGWKSIGGALALGTAGSGVAYVLYYYVLNSLGPVRASAVTFLLPVMAVFWGILLLREVVTTPMVVGMLVILSGIVLLNLRRPKPAATPVSERTAA